MQGYIALPYVTLYNTLILLPAITLGAPGALAKRALTDAAVKRLKPPASGQVDCFDQGYPGLAIRLSYGGRKSFVYFYHVGRRLRRLTLGTYPAMSLAEARETWRKVRQDVRAGRDPAPVRSTGNGATDFQGVFEEWLKRDQSGNRSVDKVRRSIEHHVLPHWKHRQIADIPNGGKVRLKIGPQPAEP